MPNFAFAKVHQFAILVHNRNPPTDTEWDPYVEFVRQNKLTRALVSTDGGAPTAAQRQRVTDVTPPNAKVAILTASAIARGVMTALSWFRPSVYAGFSPQQLEEALRFLDLPQAALPEVRRKLAELQAMVRPPH